MQMTNLNYPASQTPGARLQRGIVTTFSGVLILFLLTIMMFFAVRVGVFDQRNSSNDMRQKLAFHTAESGIHHAKEFFRANSIIASSPV
jgi:Tfp pilus assembly protein PilX